MRWIFFSLLFLNAFALVWWNVFALPAVEGDEVSAQKRPAKVGADIPELVMLHEAGDLVGFADVGLSESEVDGEDSEGTLSSGEVGEEVGPAEENVVDGGVVESGSRPSPGEKTLCELVGPFEVGRLANSFVERLSAIDIKSHVKEIELPAGPGFWIYLEPELNRKSALRRLSELQARGVDSYVIPKGDLANGISLGMFSQKSLAEKRVREMESIGLEPKTEIIERSYREIWVMLEHGEGAKMSDLTWSRVTEDINPLERRQNFCLDVAS